MTDEQKVKQHFEKSIENFDLLYTEQKNWLRKFIDKKLRYDNYERHELTLQECAKIKGKSVLDIGCGGGRYCIDMAKLGAGKVVGVDLAEKAVEMACKYANDNKVADVCSFISTDFKDQQFDEPFHVSLAIGVMDYVSDPESLISRMIEISTEKLIMSFPSKSTYRMAIRKIRYSLRGCPLYFYDNKDIEAILTKCGVKDYKIKKLGGIDNSGDYFVVVNLSENKR